MNRPPVNRLALLMIVPPALSLNALRNALAAAELPAILTPSGKDGVKITPQKGTCRRDLRLFVAGFVAGFGS